MGKSGHFYANGNELDISLDSFMKWSSDGKQGKLMPAIAEYIVSSSISAVQPASYGRYPCDLVTKDGIRIDICSSSYVQSDDGKYPDHISFCTRQGLHTAADVFVFCVFKAMTADESMLDLDLWDFYLLKTEKLRSMAGKDGMVTLQRIMSLGPVWSDYHGISEAVNTVMSA